MKTIHDFPRIPLGLTPTPLHRLAPQKGGLFTPRGVMTEEELLDPAALQRSLALAEEINGHVKEIGACAAREKRLEAEIQALKPWSACDLPLETEGTRCAAVLLGAVPNTADVSALMGASPFRRDRDCVSLPPRRSARF